DLGGGDARDLQVGAVAGERAGAGDGAGGGDGRGGEPADQFTGEAFEGDRGGEGAVVAEHVGEHRQFGQPLGGLDQVVDGDLGVLAVAHARQRLAFARVGEGAQVDAAVDDTVLDVVHGIGDVVGPVHDLAFQAAHPVGGVLADPGQAVGVDLVGAELGAAAGAAPRVFDGGVEGGAGEVQAHADALGSEDFRFQAGED